MITIPGVMSALLRDKEDAASELATAMEAAGLQMPKPKQ